MHAKRLTVVVVLVFLAALPGVAQTAAVPRQQFGDIGDLRLQSGETLRNCRIGYRTFGTLNAAKSNAVLFPTWFTGTSEQLAGFFGPGRLVDTSQLFGIAVDALADGVSSSPSNAGGAQFPKVSIADMVEAEHTLLTRTLGIHHVRAVTGISMGGMQTFEWIVRYPEFMDVAVPIVGSTRLTAYDLLLWNTEAEALRASGGAKTGTLWAGIHYLARSTPHEVASHVTSAAFPDYLKHIGDEALDAGNVAAQLQAMIGHDVSAPLGGQMERAAHAVRAKVLVVVSTSDMMVNPGPAIEFAHLIQARLIELVTDCGHLGPGCEETLWMPQAREFITGQK